MIGNKFRSWLIGPDKFSLYVSTCKYNDVRETGVLVRIGDHIFIKNFRMRMPNRSWFTIRGKIRGPLPGALLYRICHMSVSIDTKGLYIEVAVAKDPLGRAIPCIDIRSYNRRFFKAFD